MKLSRAQAATRLADHQRHTQQALQNVLFTALRLAEGKVFSARRREELARDAELRIIGLGEEHQARIEQALAEVAEISDGQYYTLRCQLDLAFGREVILAAARILDVQVIDGKKLIVQGEVQ